jgi:hypothetical protein
MRGAKAWYWVIEAAGKHCTPLAHRPRAHGVAAYSPGTDDGVNSFTPTMSQPESPQTPPSPSLQGLTREQKMALLHEELLKLNAQLEYLRLMLKLRPRKPPQP